MKNCSSVELSRLFDLTINSRLLKSDVIKSLLNLEILFNDSLYLFIFSVFNNLISIGIKFELKNLLSLKILLMYLIFSLFEIVVIYLLELVFYMSQLAKAL